MSASLETIEADIRAAIERARAEGWRIQSRRYVSCQLSSRACCALGAFHRRVTTFRTRLKRSTGDVYVRWARMRWGAPESWTHGLIAGFDGGTAPRYTKNSVRAAYDLGRRLREEYVDE